MFDLLAQIYPERWCFCLVPVQLVLLLVRSREYLNWNFLLETNPDCELLQRHCRNLEQFPKALVLLFVVLHFPEWRVS